MASTVTALGHGNNPFYGPNQMLISDALGQRAVIDLNTAAVNSVVARTATGLSVVAGSSLGGGVTFPLLAPNDTAGAPSYSFASDPDTGMFRVGANTVGISAGGSQNMAIGTTNITTTVPVLAPDGTVSAPSYSFTNAPDTGLYFEVLPERLCFAEAGVRVGILSNFCISLGINAAINGSASVAIGNNVTAPGDQTVAIGDGASSTGNSSVVIGRSAVVTGAQGIVIGDSAGSSGMGADNIAIGRDALDGTKTAAVTGIVAIGADAMTTNLGGVSAVNSVAIGHSALTLVTNGVGNTAVGFNAGDAITTGSSNTFVGLSADGAATLSSQTAVGASAVTIGASSVALGASARATTNSIAIGEGAIANGQGSVIIGRSAGSSGAIGDDNVAIGRNALNGTVATPVAGIVAIGSGAMTTNLNGVASVNSVAIGFSALTLVTNGVGNTAVGFNAGDAITTGSSNTFVGLSADGAATVSNQTALGAGSSCTQAGATALGQGVTANIADGLFIRSATAVVAAGNSMNFLAGGQIGPTTSSIRFKTDVALAPVDVDVAGELKPIDRIRVVDFEAKTNATGERLLGVIAEELAPLVHPSLIPKDEEGDPFGVSYDRLTCLLIQEVQLMRRRLAVLEGKPLPALDPYVPVREADLYDDTKVDNALMALQKQQGRDRLWRLRVEKIADRIAKHPARESAILGALNKTTRDAVRAEMEERAMKEAAAEAAEAQRVADAEAARVARLAAADAERLAADTAEKEARLDSLARKRMASGDIESAGPKMKARIAALVAADRAVKEAARQAELVSKAEAETKEAEEKELEENWEKE